MNEYFKLDAILKNFLFYGWTSHDKDHGIIWMCVAVAGMVFLLEILRTVNKRLELRMKEGPSSFYRNVSISDADVSPLISALRIPPSHSYIRKYRILYHLLQTVFMTLQLAFGYIVMLAVMSYNAWVFFTVVAASGFSYLIFSAIRDSFKLKRHSNQGIINELNRQGEENSLIPHTDLPLPAS